MGIFKILISILTISITAFAESEDLLKVQMLEDLKTYKKSSFYTSEEKEYIESLKGKKFIFVESETSELIAYDEKFRRTGMNSLIYDILSSYYEIQIETKSVEDFNSAYDEVKNGLADALMGVTHNEKHDKHMEFSTPLFPEEGGVFTVAENLHDIERVYFLKSSVWNNSSSLSLCDCIKDLSDPEIIEVDSFDKDVLLDSRNAVFSSEFALQKFTDSDIRGIKFTPLISSYVSIGFGKQVDPEFIRIIDKGVFNLFNIYIREYIESSQEEQREKLFFLNLTPEEEEYLRSNTSIRVLLHSNYFPEIYYDNKSQEFNGSYYDTISHFAKVTGLRVEVVNPPYTEWKKLLEDFDNKEGDMLFLTNNHQKIDNKYINSKNIFKEEIVLVGLKESQVYTTNPIDYIGFRKGVLFDSVGKIILKDYLSLSREQVTGYEDFYQMVKGLYRNDIDYAVMPLGVYKYHKIYNKRDKLKVVASFYETDLKVAFGEDQRILRDIFDKALTTGSIDTDTFHNKWESYTNDFEGIIKEKNFIIKKELEKQGYFMRHLIILSVLMFISIIFIFHMYKRLKKVNIKLNRTINYDHFLDVPNQNYFEKEQNSRVLNSDQVVVCISIANKKELDQTKSFDELRSINLEIVRALKTSHCAKSVDRIYSFNSIFVLIMTIEEDIKETLDKLKDDIKENMDKGITLLISYAHNELEDENLRTLFERAYFTINNPMKKEVVLRASSETIKSQKEKIFLAEDMLRALEEEEFFPYFQPKVRNGSLEVCGAEALSRWIHPVVGMISPAKYIEMAEENGNILRLDLYIAEKAIEVLSQWLRRKVVKKDFKVAFNFSMFTLETFNIHMKIVEIASKYGVSPKNLEIEITENLLSEDIEKVSGVLEKLRNLGFSIAIDDFSAGNASLSHLLSLEVDTLKIDKALVRNLNSSGDKGIEVYRSIVDISKKLNMRTVVEGIETREQLDLITGIDIDMIQGFYFSKPLSEEDFEEYLRGSVPA